ncbi:tetratricopeptide repeat protein [Bauldia sp.]|uniref:tetratricopeptide repeat protein n=1 Tax=Bauldia sp. TaxID=2575872 RepID=UPI003BAA3DB8
MVTDKQGNRLSAASTADAALFDQALEAFNTYRGDPVAVLDTAIAARPDFAMGHILKAYLFALATEPDATQEARAIVEVARSLELDDREASHIAVLDLLNAGEWTAAAVALDHHNLAYPRDLVALQSGHLMDFYRADARNLRDRIARVLPMWSADVPGYPIVLGMYAFGLEEAGDYGRAEEAGRQALDLQPLDCWAHHAVAHVMEMQGRAQDGIGWMSAREPHWTGDDNFFKVHNWWHKALFHLDLGQTDEVFALYDNRVRGDDSEVALDLVDASALLWRLHVSGQDVGDRWNKVATAWEQHADGKLYPFNDWHAAMAYLGAGRESDVERILATYRDAANDDIETSRWARQVAEPLIAGFAAFWRGDYETAAMTLHAVRHIANRFGGSHAQRDVIDWTLIEASMRGNLHGLAEGLANERVALKPHSPVNRRYLDRSRRAGKRPQLAA